MRRAAVLLLIFFSLSAWAQQIYRWTDEKGRVHVTDTPPPPSAKDVKRRAGGRAPDTTESAGPEPYALQVARQSFPVTLYTTPGCEACGDARKLLNSRGIPFKEVSVNDVKGLEELKKAVGSDSVPALIVGDSVQKGFQEAAYHQLLDAAGYPKAGILPPRKQQEPKSQTEAKPAPVEETAPSGPYAPGAPPQRSQKK